MSFMDTTDAAGMTKKEKHAAYMRKYRQENPDKTKKAGLKYRQKRNKDDYNKHCRMYYQKNSERRKEWVHRYYQKNFEKVKSYVLKYREKTKEELAAIKTMQFIQAGAELVEYAKKKGKP